MDEDQAHRRYDDDGDPTVNVRALIAAATRRTDDLREQESHHVRDVIKLRSDYDDKLRDAESKRIDAIRAVDVGAVAAAAQVAESRATTLATQVATSAEAMRVQVAATATAASVGLTAALEPIQKDIADLRRVQYEAVGGKEQVTTSQAKTGSWGLWIGLAVTATAAFTTFLLGVVGVVIAVLVR